MAEANCIRACRHCGASLSTEGRRKYCDERCRAGAKKGRRRGYGSKPRVETRWREAACERCAKPFMSRPSGSSRDGWTRYCSRECAQQGRHILDGTSRAIRPIVVRTYHGHCSRCSKHYRKAAFNQVYCSVVCASAKWVPSHKACAECGGQFMQAERWQRTCCDACQSRAKRRARRVAKARRRAATRGRKAQSIDPIKVFERDGWRCHLCGCRTPKALRGTCDPRAPELDHIVTLADGGTHTWGNVACACRACNGAKSARSMGQLRLGFAA